MFDLNLAENRQVIDKAQGQPAAAAGTALAAGQRHCWKPRHAEPAAGEELCRCLLGLNSKFSVAAAGGGALCG